MRLVVWERIVGRIRRLVGGRLELRLVRRAGFAEFEFVRVAFALFLACVSAPVFAPESNKPREKLAPNYNVQIKSKNYICTTSALACV